MNILFLIKFYEPFDRGGSEWSTHDLAKLLTQKGHQVTIITPNYGAKPHQTIEKIKILRLPFIKLKNPKASITPWWTNNLFWFIYTSVYLTWFVVQNKPDLIHVHSNEFLPAAAIVSKITKTPAVVTFRDYQVICNLGFCLWKRNKACNLKDYFTQDFQFFYENYIDNKNPITYLILLVAAVRGLLMQKILKLAAKQILSKVAVSQKVAEIFAGNGLGRLKVIHNPVIISARLPKNTPTGIVLAPQAMKLQRSADNEIVYVGRLSKGKGTDMLLDASLQISHKLPYVKLKIIGSGVLRQKLEKKIKISGVGSKVILTGQLSHNQVLTQIKKAALVVVPSIWPEPLPRSVIESLLLGVPVVATKRGGIAEIVVNNRYGILANPDKRSLAAATITAYKKKGLLHQNILKDLPCLRHHFSEEVANAYIQLFEAMTKINKAA